MVAMLIICNILTIVIFYDRLVEAVICMLIVNAITLGLNFLMMRFYIGGAYFAVNRFEYNDKKKIKVDSGDS